MRYVFVSDIHGCYDKLIAELCRVKFDKEKDTLVSIGDPFDRGPQNAEVLEFLMSLPHRILLWGNHDARLREILSTGDWNVYDIHNGTDKTLLQWTGQPYIGLALQEWHLQKESNTQKYAAMWEQYKKEAVWAIEFKDLIATHCWLPRKQYINKWNDTYEICELSDNWRDASYNEWYESSWGVTPKYIRAGLFPEKTLIVGHWHAWRLAIDFLNENRCVKQPDGREEIDCNLMQLKDKVIAIDGCSNWIYGGCVNAYVYETDEEPKKFPAKIK